MVTKHKILIIVILLFSCSEKEKISHINGTNARQIDTVKYAYTAFNMGYQLNLLTDGNFISNDYNYSCFGGGERTMVFGRYEKYNTELKLFPEKVKFTEYSDDLVPKSSTKISNFKLDSLEYKTSYKIIKWNGQEYLLSEVYDQEEFPEYGIRKENDFIRLAEYYNSGIEPEDHGMYLVEKNQIADTVKGNLDLKQIPLKWRSYFLEEPIVATILKVEKVRHPFDPSRSTWQVELNKGSENHITNLLSFEGKDGNYLMNVTRVTNNRTYGYFFYDELNADNLPIGMELRTKWEK